LLAARIGHTEFAEWVDSELHGYEPGVELPDYRRLGHGRPLSDFSGYLGAWWPNVGLPMGQVDDDHQEFLLNVDLRQPVSGLEELAASETDLGVPWPGDYIGHYGRVGVFVEGHSPVAARTMTSAGDRVRAERSPESRA
jgi:hypothetical protein